MRARQAELFSADASQKRSVNVVLAADADVVSRYKSFIFTHTSAHVLDIEERERALPPPL